MIRREFDDNGNQSYFKDSESNARDLEDLAGVFEEEFKVRVNAFIDGKDFCNAVRRCLLKDLLAGAMDEKDDDKRKKHG
ncbi:hypothetical protein CR203_20720 [Salipaludibacillus neizhouensis]|uniref:Uncharacterized protein n=1 Tax=Salipaludibacillus neizhouensis TaxID=885475 RepID=A0A3A9KKG9_9BACI|nr:hypothetical protein [Salipaludibacillus neizhouensis]RKL65376.1 hypothetical protein CR203_20720 [Salipaludibacillus neizhouensis]